VKSSVIATPHLAGAEDEVRTKGDLSMNKRIASYAVAGGVMVAAGLAAFQSHSSPASTTTLSQASSSFSAGVPVRQKGPALPPNHPPIDTTPPFGPGTPLPANEAAEIAWAAPPNWHAVPNPSPMRIATYRVPRAPGETEDAELSVTRAGGTANSNADRWMAQFDRTASGAREEETIEGFKVTVVSVNGTFLGGGMMGAPSSPRTGWALLGAIVEANGSPYFFKLVGPANTVNAARVPFQSMIAGLRRL
jgi:hypothetical protein